MLAATQAPDSSAAQFRVLERFVRTTAVDANLPRICASMATDAFADNNGGVARLFLRAAGFVECYLAGGAAFLEGLRTDDGARAVPSAAAYLSLLERTTPRSGLLAELRARATCRCLQPLEKK
jgi:hypothetical protein